MPILENFLKELRHAHQEGASRHQVEEWGRSPLLQEHELVEATYACLAEKNGLKPPKLTFTADSGGAIALFKRGFLPWRSLPYPKEHAELGACLAQLSDPDARRTAQEMVRFQEATLDHTKRPAYSLFLQEGAPFREPLESANADFFRLTGQMAADTLRYSHEALGMVSRRTETSTLICVGSGCKSGLGLFLNQDAGIINWGPQTTPVGTSAGFGLAGRAQKVQLEDTSHRFSLSFQCRLATPAARDTGFSHLQDAGYSGQWIKATLSGDQEELVCDASIQSLSHRNAFLFTFFGKGQACLVAKSHKLNPRSLDRYLGPSQLLTLKGSLGEVHLGARGDIESMEIIPLAGDDSFWGADFLIAYTLQGSDVRFTLQKNT